MEMELMLLSIIYLLYQQRGTHSSNQSIIFILYIITSFIDFFNKMSITFRKMDVKKPSIQLHYGPRSLIPHL